MDHGTEEDLRDEMARADVTISERRDFYFEMFKISQRLFELTDEIEHFDHDPMKLSEHANELLKMGKDAVTGVDLI